MIDSFNFQLERGKVKCARYWPDLNKTEKYGIFQVQNVSEDANKDYTLREFVVTQSLHENSDTNNGSLPDEEQRRVYHYHFQVSFFFIF